MKNLKKVLSLVLALAMALSLMTVAFAVDASDYADSDKITNTEAVSVLSALNVIDGKDNNLFDPTGTVTRAEMAKMITVIALGDVDISAFKGTTTDLKDIGGWSEAYVKYCYSQGIISGRGNGIFDPNANVTAAEAAKMLLVTIGYSAKVQGYEGSNWKINTVRDAQLSGFFKDLSVTADHALTRDEAAQMIYNAVDATMIEKTSSVNRVDGTITDTYAPYADGRDLLKETFGVTTFEGILDQFSYNSDKSQWTYEVEAVGLNITQSLACNSITVTGSPATSIQGDFKSTTDYTGLFMNRVKVLYSMDKNNDVQAVYGIYATKSSVVAEGVVGDITAPATTDKKVKIDGTYYNLTNQADATNIYEFGNDNTAEVTANANKLSGIGTYAAATTRQLTYNFKLIDNTGDGKGDLVITYPTSIEKVTYVGTKSFTTARGDNAASNLSNGAGTVKFEDVATYTGLAKDDFVVVTEAANSPKNIETFEKLDVLSGTVSAVKSADYLVQLDGTWYSSDLYAAGTFNAGTKMSYVLVNGYVVYSDTTASVNVSDLAVVVKQASAAGLDATYTTKLLKSDGTTVVVEAADAGTPGNMYKIGTNSDGYTTLTSVNDTNITTSNTGFDFIAAANSGDTTNATTVDSATFTLKSGTTPAYFTVGGNNYYVNDDAVVFVYDGTNYSVITGAKLKATSTSLTNINFFAASKNSSTGYTNVDVAYVKAGITTSTNYAYVTADTVKYNPESGKYYTEVTFWDGTSTQTLKTETMADSGVVADVYALSKGDVFSYKLNADGDIKSIDAYAPQTMQSGATASNKIDTAAVVAYADNMLNLSEDFFDTAASVTGSTFSKTLKITDDTVIFYVSTADKAGVEGGSIQLASSNAIAGVGGGTAHNYANVRVISNAGNTEVALLIVDVNNDILDIQ